MIYSMTGFATKTIEVPVFDNNRAHLSILLKSLNSRFFEVTCKLPHALQSLEVDLIKVLKDSLHRGKVTFTISMSNPLLFKGPVEPSFYMVQSYLDALTQIQKKYSIPGTISISELLNLPNIFIEEEGSLNQTMQQLIMQATRDLITEMRKTQHSEGVALQKDIEKRVTILQQEICHIKTLAAHIMEKHKVEVSLKLSALTTTPELLELTQHQLYSDLERMDIHEEVVRFESHIQQLAEFIHSDHKEKGRRIDFILQELMREVNTMSSKCSDTTISSHAISIKVELEKIREQAQNIV